MRRKLLVVAAWVIVSAILSFASPAAAAQSPVLPDPFAWDLRVTGVIQGSAYLTFNDDLTINGYGIVIPTPRRGVTETINFGFFVVTGDWGFDSRGRVIGNLASAPDADVRIDVESFTAIVARTGRTIRITGEETNGRIILTGAPAAALTDLDGTAWSADVLRIEGRERHRTIEFFDLVAACVDADCPDRSLNLYNIVGTGPNLCVFGTAMLSKGNRFGIVTEEVEKPDPPDDCTTLDPAEEEGLISGAIGILSPRTFRGVLFGNEEGSLDKRVRMTVSQD